MLAGLVRSDAGTVDRLLSLGPREDQAFAHFAVYNQVSCYLFTRLSDEGVFEQCPARLVKRISRQRQR